MSDNTLPDSSRLSKRTVVLICCLVMALGSVVWWNYYLKLKRDELQGRLPLKGQVKDDLPIWVDQAGVPRTLNEAKGKVIVFSYVYTTCPSGCAGVAERMAQLQKQFGDNPNFQLISVSLYPEHDRPEMLQGWIAAQKFTPGKNWWFLTSKDGTPEQGEAIRGWMTNTFKISVKRKSEEHIQKNPADVWDHSLVMAVVDHRGNIRTPTDNEMFWYPFHPAFDNDWFPRPIADDLAKLLEDAK
jgi:protein SCO1